MKVMTVRKGHYALNWKLWKNDRTVMEFNYLGEDIMEFNKQPE